MNRPYRVTVSLLAILAVAGPAAAQGLKPQGLLEGMAPDESELDMRTTPVVRAVQRAADSVVSIYMLDALNGNPEEALEGQGSGVIADASGLVITNWHVVAAAVAAPTRHRLQVRLRDDRRFEAVVLTSSPDHDLALLQLTLGGERIQPITAGRSDSLMIGETVIAIGNPQGQANTVTVGVLSATNRGIAVRAPDGVFRNYQGLLQTDAAINRGNSGGALLDITGKLIGINNAMANDAENIGFAIPVDTVKRVFQDVLLSSDNLANVWLGLTLEDSERGPVVAKLVAYGPAARAGVRKGDLIRTALGQAVRSKLDFTRAVATARSGTSIPLVIVRADEQLELSPTAMSGVERELAMRTGLELDTVTSEADPALLENATRSFYQGTSHRRVPLLPLVLRVRAVVPESPAADLGLKPGDVILGTRVADMFGARTLALRSLEDLTDRARDVAGRALFLVVLRDKEMLEGELDIRRI